MLETTFIGHQGWQFAAERGRILVDPLLTPEFGHRGGVGEVFPPRRIDLSALGEVDAVLLTHEHEDHFNIPSLAKLSRRTPIYVPERASFAMKQILLEMDFKVRAVAPGDTLEFGDLEYTALSADHVANDEQDEWETTPFLVVDKKDGGSFFTPVDVSISAAIETELRKRRVVPGLVAYANNAMNLSFQERPAGPAPAQLPVAARFLLDHLRVGGGSLASLICGGGFSFTGTRAWMNKVFFPLDSDALFAAIGLLDPNGRYLVALPGLKITSTRDCIVTVEQGTAFVSALPRDQWPDRRYDPSTAPPQQTPPASGRTRLQEGELDELIAHLESFAASIYGSALFRALYSLGGGELARGVRSRFAISAVTADQEHLFEYDPMERRFTLVQSDATLEQYAAGLECHATDLLDFLRGRVPPSSLMFGRMCRWRGCGRSMSAAIDRAIWLYGHPLNRPKESLDLYRAILAELDQVSER